jgi:four helix bundle protein
MVERYKIQRLQMYQLALEYVDAVYELSEKLPQREWANLSSQIERAATSIVLNIAEGSSKGSNSEQNRFLELALRSYLETVTCLDLIELRNYLSAEEISPLREQGHGLFIELSAFRKALR